MKKASLIILVIVIIYSCKSGNYMLSDTGEGKTFLVEQIDELVKKNLITKHPLIVIDGIEYRYDKELKKGKLPISKDDIASIDLVKPDKAKKIYSGGIILITTKSYKKQNSKEKN